MSFAVFAEGFQFGVERQSADVIETAVEGASFEHEGCGASQFAYAATVGEAESQEDGGQRLQFVRDLICGDGEGYFEFVSGFGKVVKSRSFPGQDQFTAAAANPQSLISLSKIPGWMIEVIVLFECCIVGESKAQFFGVQLQLCESVDRKFCFDFDGHGRVLPARASEMAARCRHVNRPES